MPAAQSMITTSTPAPVRCEFLPGGRLSGGTTGSSGSYIGEAAATAAALTHAGVSEADTIYLRCWVEHDDGRAECYEVEFLAGTTEYQYEIDLYTGAVLKSERESHSVPASAAPAPTLARRLQNPLP